MRFDSTSCRIYSLNRFSILEWNYGKNIEETLKEILKIDTKNTKNTKNSELPGMRPDWGRTVRWPFALRYKEEVS